MPERKKKNNPTVYYLFFFLLFLIAFAAGVLLFPVYRNYQKKQARLAELSADHNRLKRKSAELNSEVAGLRTNPKSIEKVAREKFGLVKEGESVLKYEPPEEEELRSRRNH